MKMKVIDRIILAFYAVVSAAALFIMCLCFIAPVSAVDLDAIRWMRPVSWLLVLGLVVWCVRLIRLQFKPDGSAPKNSAAVQSTEEGDVRVSVRAMETLARRAIVQTGEVLDSKLRIVNNDASVGVEIDIVVDSDTHVPALTALLQRNIKGIIEEYAGVAVDKVVVLVTEIRETTPALPAAEPVQAVVVEAEKVEVHEEAAAPVEDKADEEADEEETAEAEATCAEAEAEEEAEEEAAATEAEEAEEEAAVEAEESEEKPAVFETDVAEEWAATVGRPVGKTDAEDAGEKEEPVA